MKRREFLHVISAAGAAAALPGCARGGGPDHLTPYLEPAENGVDPGVSVEYSTVCRECPAGCGMIARVRDGRAYKVEGNPDHPINHGKLCLRGQASLQGLYNPDRFRQPLARDSVGRLMPISWDDAMQRLGRVLSTTKHAAWMGPLETGALDALIDRWLSAVAPSHSRVHYEPYAYEPLRTAAARVFGQAEVPEFRLDRARMILSFGADFVETWISNVEYTRQFSAFRQRRISGVHRGRYIFIGSRLSLSGANADEWITIRPGSELAVARALLLVTQAAKSRAPVPADALAPLAAEAGVKPATLERIGRELAASSSPIVLPPGNAHYQAGSAEVCEAVLRLNAAAGAVGKTLLPDWPHALGKTATREVVNELTAAMASGQVDALFLHNVNPVHSLPRSSGFVEAAAHVREIVSFSSYPDETTGMTGQKGGLASLVLPDHTPLESWGDYAPRNGILGVLQPAVSPVFDTRALGDVLLGSAATLSHTLGAGTFEELVRKSYPVDDAAWLLMLQRGGQFNVVEESAVEEGADVSPGIDQIGASGTVPRIGMATSLFAGPEPALLNGATPLEMPMAMPLAPAMAAESYSPAAPPGLSIEGDLPPGTTGHSPLPTNRYTPGGAVGPSRAFPGEMVEAGADTSGAIELTLEIYPSLHLFDGRMANRPWAQEIPDPQSKAVWGSWAEIHPDTAKKLGAANGTLLSIRTEQGRVDVPASLTRNVHPSVIAIQQGRGRTLSGRFADGFGVNPVVLAPGNRDRSSGGPVLSGFSVSVRSLPVSRPVVVLQTSTAPTEPEIARGLELKELKVRDITRRAAPLSARDRPSLYHTEPVIQHPKSSHKWGMVIDLDRCVGCNACAAACYAENNVPVVGQEECARGREMAWITIQNYGETEGFPGSTDAADSAVTVLDNRFFPMVCQQCDNAPCEYVCPVDATVHSDEGLNMQVYNRCVGTKYCSNNCPYKVRRFNWFSFEFESPLDQQLNPDVIQRKKGVMEKCTFCIQRIRRAEIDADVDHRALQDGEIQTACMQSCPADAIIFGDVKLRESYVAKRLAGDRRGYGALAELNTYPNVQYMERVRVDAP